MLLLNILMADRPEASTNVDLLIWYRDDLSVLTVKDLKKILVVYKEKLFGVKSD